MFYKVYQPCCVPFGVVKKYVNESSFNIMKRRCPGATRVVYRFISFHRPSPSIIAVIRPPVARKCPEALDPIYTTITLLDILQVYYVGTVLLAV